jgi:hypothetical protein
MGHANWGVAADVLLTSARLFGILCACLGMIANMLYLLFI